MTTESFEALIKKHSAICGVRAKMKWVLLILGAVCTLITSAFGWAMYEQAKTSVHTEQISTIQSRLGDQEQREEVIENLLRKIYDKVDK